jgi:hypothetical protein
MNTCVAAFSHTLSKISFVLLDRPVSTGQVRHRPIDSDFLRVVERYAVWMNAFGSSIGSSCSRPLHPYDCASPTRTHSNFRRNPQA